MKMKIIDLGENDKYVKLDDLLKYLQDQKEFYEKNELIPCSKSVSSCLGTLIQDLKDS
jgi:hypothetical protein